MYLDTTYAAARWTFPPQSEALGTLSRLVAAELEREPRTLFLVGSYQLGKEKAIAAVVKAAGGRALVAPRRAMSLRLCGEWDAERHTEVDGDDVCVHVTALGGEGREAHANMKRQLDASCGRYFPQPAARDARDCMACT